MSKYFFLAIALSVFSYFDVTAQDTLLYETFQIQSLGEWSSTDLDALPLGPDFVGLAGGFQILGVSGPNDLRAVAVSSFEGGGTANNWLISPPITVTKSSTKLKWRGTSLSGDPILREDYRVMLSRSTGIVSDFSDILAIITNESFQGTDREVDLSPYVGQTVHVAFQQNGTNKFALTIDDILVVEPGAENDASLREITGERYQIVDNLELTTEVFNSGSNTITSLEILASYNGMQKTITVDSLDIDPQESTVIDLTDIGPLSAQKYTIDAQIISVNGQDIESDEVNIDLFMIDSNAPALDFFIEEATSTNCGWCPLGIVVKEELAVDFPFSVVDVSVHSMDDPMQVPAYDLGLRNQDGFTGVPSATVNRKAYMQMDEVNDYLLNNNRLKGAATLDVIYDYNSATRMLSATLSAFSHTELTPEDHRFGFILVEDNVTGEGPDFDQENFFSSESSNLPLVGLDGINWQDLPPVISASDMVYNNVARDILGGFDGILNSISNTQEGEIVQYDFDYLIPSTIDQNEVKLVVFITDIITGEIINVFEEEMRFVSSVFERPLEEEFRVFPNPADDHFRVDYSGNQAGPYTVELYNLAGQRIMIYEDIKNIDNQMFSLNSASTEAGSYILKITAGSGHSINKKLVIVQ